ncbi:MAG: tRNA pseudouridine(38-40) synthase TruA, partial [Acidimicrobiia bacterium]
MSQLSFGPEPSEENDATPADDAPVSSRVLKLTVAYDGTDFRGFATQLEQRTVERVLSDALARVLRGPVKLTCAGRTDSGVHAWGQVVGVPIADDVRDDVDVDVVLRAVNSMLGPEVVLRAGEVVDGSFDARRSAQWRSYRYTIVNRPVADPFLARTAWWVPEPLDLKLLRLGADPFLGTHDFTSFCRRGPEGSTTVRRVFDSSWHDLGDGVLRYDIRASAFCWRMVRSIVGTLANVGLGKITPGEVLQILRACDR